MKNAAPARPGRARAWLPWAGAALLAAVPAVGRAQPVGAEFQVNTYTTQNQNEAALAAAADGSFVVTWSSNGPDGQYLGIFGQRYDAAGVRRGGEFQINTYTTQNQKDPAIVSDASGNFVVVWTSYAQDGSGQSVIGRRYNAAGVAQGGEFLVNTSTAYNQEFPNLGMDGSGNFVVVWAGPDQDNVGVFGQRFSAAAVKQGVEFQINVYTTMQQYDPAVARDAAGNFVVVWRSNGQDGAFYGIFGRRYNASGVAQGSEFRINSYNTNNQRTANISMDGSGNFVVVWQSITQDGDAYGVFGQRFNASAVAQGSEFQVNTYTTGYQGRAWVTAEPSGSFLVVWHDTSEDGDGLGVFGRRYDAAGTPVGGDFQINSFTTGAQRQPAAVSTGPGSFIVAWHSVQDGSSYGVFGRRVLDDLIFANGFEP
jgi:hypothetical protein